MTEKENISSDVTVDSSSRILDIIKGHPAIVVSLLYVWFSFVGILYLAFLLHLFEINVFHFAVANDFFLAAFKQPAFFLVIGLVALIALLANTMKKGLLGAKDWSSGFRTKASLYLVGVLFVICTFLLPISYAYFDSRRIKEGSSRIVQLSLKGIPAQTSHFLPHSDLALITTTERFAFFYVLGQDRCVILPLPAQQHWFNH